MRFSELSGNPGESMNVIHGRGGGVLCLCRRRFLDKISQRRFPELARFSAPTEGSSFPKFYQIRQRRKRASVAELAYPRRKRDPFASDSAYLHENSARDTRLDNPDNAR